MAIFILFLFLLLPTSLLGDCGAKRNKSAGAMILIVDGKCDPLRGHQQTRGAQVAIEEANHGKAKHLQVTLAGVVDGCDPPAIVVSSLIEALVQAGQTCSQPPPFMAVSDTNTKTRRLIDGVLSNFGLVHLNAIQDGSTPSSDSVTRFEPSDLAKTLIALVKRLGWRSLFLLYSNDTISNQDARFFETFALQNGICIFDTHQEIPINQAIIISQEAKPVSDLLESLSLQRPSQVLIAVGRVGLLTKIRQLHHQLCVVKQSQHCSLIVLQPVSEQMQRVRLDPEFLLEHFNHSDIQKNEWKFLTKQELASVSDLSLDPIIQTTRILSTAYQLGIRYCQNRPGCLTSLATNRTQWRQFLNDIVIFEKDQQQEFGRRRQRRINSIREKYYTLTIALDEPDRVLHVGDIWAQGHYTSIPENFHLPRTVISDLENEMCDRMLMVHSAKSFNSRQAEESFYMLVGLVAGAGTCMIAAIGGCTLVLFKNFRPKEAKSIRSNEHADSCSVGSVQSISLTI